MPNVPIYCCDECGSSFYEDQPQAEGFMVISRDYWGDNYHLGLCANCHTEHREAVLRDDDRRRRSYYEWTLRDHIEKAIYDQELELKQLKRMATYLRRRTAVSGILDEPLGEHINVTVYSDTLYINADDHTAIADKAEARGVLARAHELVLAFMAATGLRTKEWSRSGSRLEARFRLRRRWTDDLVDEYVVSVGRSGTPCRKVRVRTKPQAPREMTLTICGEVDETRYEVIEEVNIAA